MAMARNAALWLLCVVVSALAGCAWTETYQDFPPSARGDSHDHSHHQGRNHVHAD